MPDHENKRALRQDFRRRRDALSPEARQAASAAICERFVALAGVKNAQRVALYAAIGSEVDSAPAFAALTSRAARLHYPRCQADGRLAFVPITDLAALRPGIMDIPEPSGDAVPLADLEVVAVPGLAFDRQGIRLGYGGGYYDRTLADFTGLVVGLAFALQLTERLPAAPHDRRVDVVCSDAGLWEMRP